MDILVQTLRKEGFFALYKGHSQVIFLRHRKAYLSSGRNGQSTDRNCWCQLASICIVWYIAQDNITVRPALSQRDCAGWFHGWRRQRYSGKSGYVASVFQLVPGFKLSNCSGDVQSPDARPIRCEDGPTFESSSEGDVDTVGFPEGCHARILGEELSSS